MAINVWTTPLTLNLNSHYTDVQFPFGPFWIDGQTDKTCTALTNDKSINYEETQQDCYKLAYFHCEYVSEYRRKMEKFNSLESFPFR
jgi:hypothetical protein